MTEELVYDPQTKTLIRDTLFDFLYAPTQKQFQERLDTIIAHNSRLHHNHQGRIRFNGDVYEHSSPGAPTRSTNMTHPTVMPLMKEYVADLTKLNTKEIPYVLGYIKTVLNSSNSIRDYLKLFPESLHEPLNRLMAQCSCRAEHLKPETVEKIREKHHTCLDLLKTRMVKNIIMN